MYENENLVTETMQEEVAEQEVAENLEIPTKETQQTAKMYSQEEVDAIVGKRKARIEAKLRKEYERKYSGLTDVIEAGTGIKTVEEQTEAFRSHYQSKGIEVKKKNPEYSSRDIETLATADANEIINSGYEDVVDEVDRLAEIGVENMTAREKAMFRVLAEHRKAAEKAKKLAALGVGEDVYNSTEFKEFHKMFASDTPIEKVYETFVKTQPKKQIQTMGSMKQSPVNTQKDYYTPEEIEKLTDEDLKNPHVWATVRRSMTGQ